MVPGKQNYSLTLAWQLDYDPVSAVNQALMRIPEEQGELLRISRLQLLCIFVPYMLLHHPLGSGWWALGSGPRTLQSKSSVKPCTDLSAHTSLFSSRTHCQL